MNTIEFKELKGKVIKEVNKKENCIIFKMQDGKIYNVRKDEHGVAWLEDVCGDLDDLLNSEILQADEENGEMQFEHGGFGEWTFYLLATAKGYVTLRWCGDGDGYYSEKVIIVDVLGSKADEIKYFKDSISRYEKRIEEIKDENFNYEG